MSQVRGFSAARTTVLVVAMLAACTGGEPVDGSDGESPLQPTTTDGTTEESASPSSPTAEPTVDALLASAVDAVEALDVEYPELSIHGRYRYDSFVPEDDHEDLFDKHGFIEGIEVFASAGSPWRVLLRLYVFADHDEARGFRSSYYERLQVDEPVEVPGWPEVAKFHASDRLQYVTYTFVHGPAVVSLVLADGEFESPMAAGAELGTALDIVQARLDETVPIPE